MKTSVALFADFVHNFLGGPSRLLEPLAGATVLGHTLRRVAAIEGVSERALVVRPRDRDAALAALRACGQTDAFRVLDIDDGQRLRAGLIRAARKWGLGSWRGTPLGTTWFDEFLDLRCVAQVLAQAQGEAILALDAHQSVVDPRLCERMLAHARDHEHATPFVFTQAPPGLSGLLLRPEFVRDALEQQLTFGVGLAYRPETPRHDLVMREVCHRVEPEVFRAQGRLLADTRVGHDLLSAALRECGSQAEATTLCSWLSARPAPTLPTELEVELTSDTPLPASTLRPRDVPSRHWSDATALRRTLAELAQRDDTLVVFGGHGDPLCHPDFPDAVRLAREAGVCGVGVRSSLLRLDEAALNALLEGVDVIEVGLDAHTAPTYARIHGEDGFERALANMERIQARRRETVSPAPLLMPALTRCAENFGELEAFYDHWVRAVGSAVVRGKATFGGVLAEDSLLPLRPLVRTRCARLDTRLMLLADGTAVACDQDYLARRELGRWDTQELGTIWSGKGRRSLRAAHAGGGWSELAVCGDCGEWSRP